MMGDFKIGRRSLLAGSGAILSVMASGVRVQAQESVTALPDYVSWKDADALIVHSNSTIEMERSAFGTSAFTPEDRLYVRNNVAPPPASILDDRDAWEVSIDGVAEPRSLTLAELKTMGITNKTSCPSLSLTNLRYSISCSGP